MSRALSSHPLPFQTPILLSITPPHPHTPTPLNPEPLAPPFLVPPPALEPSATPRPAQRPGARTAGDGTRRGGGAGRGRRRPRAGNAPSPGGRRCSCRVQTRAGGVISGQPGDRTPSAETELTIPFASAEGNPKPKGMFERKARCACNVREHDWPVTGVVLAQDMRLSDERNVTQRREPISVCNACVEHVIQ